MWYSQARTHESTTSCYIAYIGIDRQVLVCRSTRHTDGDDNIRSILFQNGRTATNLSRSSADDDDEDGAEPNNYSVADTSRQRRHEEKYECRPGTSLDETRSRQEKRPHHTDSLQVQCGQQAIEQKGSSTLILTVFRSVLPSQNMAWIIGYHYHHH